VENSSKVDLEDLFAEKSLARIFWLAPPFCSNTFNCVVALLTFCLLAIFSVLHICVPSLRDAIKFPFADTFTLWANAGASLSGTILGFLIAGFAVLCTVLRPETIVALAKMRNERYGLSELKLLFVLFADVFAQYLSLLFVSILVLVFGGKTGPAMMLGEQLAKIHWMVPFCLLHLILTIWGTWLIMLVLSLKSFVYNLYQSLLLGLADAADDLQRKSKPSVTE
jgi:hypothetical protein